jgi:hypothetical protein
MDSLSDVITCCRGLALEKVTERKVILLYAFNN